MMVQFINTCFPHLAIFFLDLFLFNVGFYDVLVSFILFSVSRHKNLHCRKTADTAVLTGLMNVLCGDMIQN